MNNGHRKLIRRKPIGAVAFMSGISYCFTETMQCAIEMARFNARHIEGDDKHIEYVHTTISLHSKARNQLAEQRIGGPDGWMLQVDLDLIWRPSSLKTLLNTMFRKTPQHPDGLDVVCGIYHKKHPPHMPVIMNHNGKWYDEISEIPDEPFTVGGGGGGHLLVRNRVFDRIKAELKQDPFDHYYYEPTEENPDGGPLSEDLSFFKRCQRLGIEVWCDPMVQCGHIDTVAVGRQDFEDAKARLARYGDKMVLHPEGVPAGG